MAWQLGSVSVVFKRDTLSMSPSGPIVNVSRWSITTLSVSIVCVFFTAYWSPTLTESNVEFSIMRRVRPTKPE